MTNEVKENTQQEFIAKLHLVYHNLKAPKGQTNDFGKYKYRSCEDILSAVKPLLNEQGLMLRLTDEIIEIGGRVYVKATAIVFDSVNQLSAIGLAREAENKKGMDESQITGASSSYARKYALNGLLGIDDTKDADTQDNRQKVASKGNLEQIKASPGGVIQSEQPKVKSWLDKCIDLGKEVFPDPDSYKVWRVDNGFVETLKGSSDFDLLKLHQKLKEYSEVVAK